MITTIDNLSDSARILSLLSDGQWHSNDELYEISRRPGSIIFTLKERGVSLEKKKDENIRFREHWRITKPIPEELKVVDGKIRHSSGGNLQKLVSQNPVPQKLIIRATVIR